jgi:hypothetical protein
MWELIKLCSEIQGRIWIIFWPLHQSCPNWVELDVDAMFREILCVPNSMVGKALLPYRNLAGFSEPVGVASLDKLDCAFEREA